MNGPAEVYSPSQHPYQGLPDLEYPFHDRDALVTAGGRICIYKFLAGQRLGIRST